MYCAWYYSWSSAVYGPLALSGLSGLSGSSGLSRPRLPCLLVFLFLVFALPVSDNSRGPLVCALLAGCWSLEQPSLRGSVRFGSMMGGNRRVLRYCKYVTVQGCCYDATRGAVAAGGGAEGTIIQYCTVTAIANAHHSTCTFSLLLESAARSTSSHSPRPRLETRATIRYAYAVFEKGRQNGQVYS